METVLIVEDDSTMLQELKPNSGRTIFSQLFYSSGKFLRKAKKNLILSLFSCLLLLDCAAATETDTNQLTENEALAEFTIAKGEDIILLPVKFRGQEHTFIFDTGAAWVIFDDSFKDTLKSAKRREELKMLWGKPVTVEVFDAPEAFLGPLDLRVCGEVACMNLEKVSRALDEKISGVIGMNFLKKHVVKIDFDEGKLTFFKPKKDKGLFSLFQNGDKSTWGQRVNLKYGEKDNPFLKGNILGVGGIYFMIDTGTNMNFLENKIFEKIRSSQKITDTNNLAHTAYYDLQDKRIRLSDLSIGKMRYPSLIFEKVGGLSVLGNTFLFRHTVTFDFPNSKIYLKKGKKFNQIDEYDMTGLSLIHMKNQTVVHSVDEGSPASEAGIKAGDVVLKVDDKDAKEYSRWELSRLKRAGNGKKIKIKFKRDNDVKEVTITLRKRL